MKSGKLVTDYLDECARLDALKGDNEAWIAALTEGPHDQLYRACIADGRIVRHWRGGTEVITGK